MGEVEGFQTGLAAIPSKTYQTAYDGVLSEKHQAEPDTGLSETYKGWPDSPALSVKELKPFCEIFLLYMKENQLCKSLIIFLCKKKSVINC